MPIHVCNGATLKCSFAVPPGISTFVVLPIHRMITSDQPAAAVINCAYAVRSDVAWR